MTRLDAGAIVPKREAVDVGDLVSTALRRAAPLLKDQRRRHRRSRPACRRCRSISCWPSRSCSTCSTMPRNIRRPAAAIEVAARPRRRRGRDRRARRGAGHPGRGARPAVRQVLPRPTPATGGAPAPAWGWPSPRASSRPRAARIAAAQPRPDRSGAEFIVQLSGLLTGCAAMTGDAATILIVEDEPPIRRLLRATLGAHDYRTLEAATGAEALVGDAPSPARPGAARSRPARHRRPGADRPHPRDRRRCRSSCCRAAATRRPRWPRSTPAPTTMSPSRSAPTS